MGLLVKWLPPWDQLVPFSFSCPLVHLLILKLDNIFVDNYVSVIEIAMEDVSRRSCHSFHNTFA